MKHYKIRKTPIERSDNSVGIYLKTIRHLPGVYPSEELRLLRAAQAGDTEAEHRLVEGNLRFVVTIAKQYQDQGVPLCDLIQAGNVGLIRAIESFDTEKPIKFITYAVWWIRKIIIKELNLQNNSVSIPEVNITLKSKIDKAVSKFEVINEREPTLDELAELLQVDEETLKITLDGFLSKCEEEEELPSNEEEKTPSMTISASLDEIMKAKLTSLEYEILNKNLGLRGITYCADDLTVEYGMSKERVRQLRNSAITKLKKCPEFITLLQNEV